MSSRIIRTTPRDGPDGPDVAETPTTPVPSANDVPRVTRFQFRTAGQATLSQPSPLSEGRINGIDNPAVVASLTPETVQEQCERLLQEARMKVSEIEKEAYEQGFSEGRKAGSEVGEQMGDALLKQYSVGLEAFNKLRKELFASSEREVIRLSLEIAKKIIKREVAIDEELILTLVKVALSRVADQALMTVRVNPKDFHTIERHRAVSTGGTDAGALSESVKLVEDPLIARGGCIIETESGTIDARIEEQLRAIEKGFFE